MSSSTNSATVPESPKVDPEQLKRAVLASSVGSALEYYDFYIYGLATALIFGPLFFQPLGPAGGMIASFGTYAVGFAARPIGGLVFGHLGDKLGRKMILIITIALMGGSSFLIGLLPTYETAGMLGAILLVTLRIFQGLGAGAEQAGATVLISEFAPPKRRGFFAALPFVGIQVGTLLGAGTFALLALAHQDVLHTWLWRLPFLLGAVLILVAVWIRAKLKESPTFEVLEQEGIEPEKISLGEALRTSRKNILIGIGLRMAENGNSSIYSALLLAFIGTIAVYKGANIGPVGAVVAAVVSIFTVVAFGALSDRLGRVKVYRYAALFQAIIALPGFYLITLGNPWLVILVMAVGIGIGVQGHARAAVLDAAGALRQRAPLHRRRDEPRDLRGPGRRYRPDAGRRVPGCHEQRLVDHRHLLAGALADHVRHHVRDARDPRPLAGRPRGRG